jgi:hypothetical protein
MSSTCSIAIEQAPAEDRDMTRARVLNILATLAFSAAGILFAIEKLASRELPISKGWQIALISIGGLTTLFSMLEERD